MSQTQTRTVCVVRIWRRRDTDIHVADDRVSAYGQLFTYVKENWSDAFGVPVPQTPSDSMLDCELQEDLDHSAMIKNYFEKRDDEGYEIYENCQVAGLAEPNRWAIFDFDDETMISHVYNDYEECVNDANQLDNGCIIPMHVGP